MDILFDDLELELDLILIHAKARQDDVQLEQLLKEMRVVASNWRLRVQEARRRLGE